MSHISQIDLDDGNLPPPTPEIEQERRVAMFDLMEENSFTLPARDGREVPAGPYKLGLAIREKRLVFDIATEADEKAAEFHLSLSPFRQVVKDYFQICKSYFDAVKTAAPSQIETIDMARRGIHNEGARILQERLEGKAEVDDDTARRLFTLICVLHFGG
ncbi:UPF0262 family protein [Salipiger bermudensis]|uniref:UPF0262 family protein n=1 Tax=Salipiger bermudensis TaxID=344736 RepID=UPI000C97B398|nr:UPF0262 family protein [Salipiger bermudensis]MAE88227.1 hypothetical protein [Pelagibaca sp.]MBN9674302.1 UPF0262 family protein [Salipiger bermudensis]MBR9890296.1 UPF0262 family protein [bacterium]MCA1286327.1 UPF0262 family protein [Salipiger bermudensis]